MRRGRFTVITVLCVWATVAWPRAFEVRRIGEDKSRIWGTDEFSVQVTPFGVLRHLKVRGKEVIWQVAALYTFPVPAAGAKGVRTVQGESGGRGMSVTPPEMLQSERNGTQTWELDHIVSTKTVMDGSPLCRVKQKLTIAPTGEISVTYDCTWLGTLRWDSFLVLMIFNKDTCADRPFIIVDAGDPIRTGILDVGKGTVTSQRMRNVSLSQFSIRTATGPVHIVSDGGIDCGLSWNKGIDLRIKPENLPYRNVIAKGHTGRISYRILLPVSQQ